MSAQPQPDEFCPRCGHWVTALGERTGWCTACSGEEAQDGQVCTRCSRPRPADHYKPGSSHKGKVCRACRTAVRNAWRAAHLEHSRAYERERRYGQDQRRGRCPVCGYKKRLLADGTVASHQPSNGWWVTGAETCPGRGQEPVA